LTRRPSFAVNAATRGPERDRGWLCRGRTGLRDLSMIFRDVQQ